MFADAFQKYIIAAQNARAENKLEQERKRLFLSFLQEAFHIDYTNVDIEQSLILTNERRGFLDALFGDLLFEFKRSLDSGLEKTRDQLLEYLKSSKRDLIGILSDGLKFQVYLLEDGKLRQTDAFELKADDPDGALVRLDAYLFIQKAKPPTSADIVGRFGGNSPTFQAAFKTLGELLEKAKAFPALAVWREQWDKLLSKVYGSNIADDNLYLRHTYLNQFAKLLAYSALVGLPDDDATIERILSGDAFEQQSVNNIGENDFFSWVLLPQIKAEAVSVFRRLAAGLIVYNLNQIDQDLLKQLYQNLVDPATRHDLGEYYTPDWLAELTLEDINYHHPQSLLDPACGSGSFLFAAINHLAKNGLTGWQLVRFAADNIMGMDVHPLAVTIARINYLLALAPHLKTTRPSGERGEISLPVYLADALNLPIVEGRHKDALIVPVNERNNENFYVPVSAATAPNALTQVIEQMDEFAKRASQSPDGEVFLRKPFETVVRQNFSTSTSASGEYFDTALPYWQRNLTLLAKLMREQRNGIWAYILKNQSRPMVLAERQFDVIVGNPPWLSYRFIKSKTYQKEVKRLYKYYGLIEIDDQNLFTQMDLSTLFFAHARERYLKQGGTLAFVMPRAVITGAKQHRPFQAKGLTRVIDLLGVVPLFNVPTCVTIFEGGKIQLGDVPANLYTGKLNRHEMNLSEALPTLTKQETKIRFVDSDVRSEYYYKLFQQGATLVPRNLCFVKPQGNPNSLALTTDPEVNKDAKAPYKGITLVGSVEDDYIYATLLSKHLVPFGFEKLNMVALPVALDEHAVLHLLNPDKNDFVENGHFKGEEWFRKASGIWNNLKKQASTMTLIERLDYQKLLTKQNPRLSIKVLYNHSGTHLSSCVIDLGVIDWSIYGRHTNGFVVDVKTYYADAVTLEEAHYLCALLNAECVDNAIKAYQTRGIFKGERDIHRTPFEACTIPPFDATNADHQELTRLSQAAHTKIEAFKSSGALKGSVYAIRDQARAEVKDELEAIDVVARRVLNLQS